MDNLAERIRRVIEDMHVIQEFLTRNVADAILHGNQGHTCSPDLEQVKQLKTAVDNMRTMLWSYVESVTTENGQNFGDRLQALRMQRTTEMLHAMNEEMGNNPLPDAAETRSFFEALQRVASVVVDRHMPQIRVEQKQHEKTDTGLFPEE